MDESTKLQIEKMERTVKEMAKCNPLTLSAAITMLPDYMEEGTEIVLSAASRIIAENYYNSVDESVQLFRKMVQQHIQQMKESGTLKKSTIHRYYIDTQDTERPKS